MTAIAGGRAVYVVAHVPVAGVGLRLAMARCRAGKLSKAGAVYVACRAAYVMSAGKREVTCVVESRWRPGGLCMALCAICGEARRRVSGISCRGVVLLVAAVAGCRSRVVVAVVALVASKRQVCSCNRVVAAVYREGRGFPAGVRGVACIAESRECQRDVRRVRRRLIILVVAAVARCRGVGITC